MYDSQALRPPGSCTCSFSSFAASGGMLKFDTTDLREFTEGQGCRALSSAESEYYVGTKSRMDSTAARDLARLQSLSVIGFTHLTGLPGRIGQLCSLMNLEMVACTRCQLPSELGKLSCLDIDEEMLLALPDTLCMWGRLWNDDNHGCSSLHVILGFSWTTICNCHFVQRQLAERECLGGLDRLSVHI